MAESTSHIVSEPALAYGMNSYTDVMSMLHSMPMDQQVKEQVARRLVLEVESKYLSKAFARLDHLCQLKDGWDGYGGRKISYQVIDNLRQVLLISDDKDWEDWMIAPASNGTVGLQSKLSIASISMGNKEYSYYSCRDGNEDWGDLVPFRPSEFLEVMRRIV